MKKSKKAHNSLSNGWPNAHGAANPQTNTREETFQPHLIDTTIFQIKSFDVLYEFALLISYATCSAYSAVLTCESEKMSQQKKKIFILSKLIWDIRIFLNRTTALLAVLPDQQRDRMHKFCVLI